MRRGRPSFDPRVGLYIWVLIETYREPTRAGRPRASIRQASERLRRELRSLCNIDMSMERLRKIHQEAMSRLNTDADLRRFAIWTLAKTIVLRRELLSAGRACARRQIIPLLLSDLS